MLKEICFSAQSTVTGISERDFITGKYTLPSLYVIPFFSVANQARNCILKVQTVGWQAITLTGPVVLRLNNPQVIIRFAKSLVKFSCESV